MDKERIKNGKRTVLNTIMLFLLSMAKIVFPLITLPFLTRVLSKDCYGAVSYVKSIIAYAQIIIDFGFVLSSVNDIVRASDKKEVDKITGDTIVAKLLLSGLAFTLMLVLSFAIPILREYRLLLLLSFVPAFLSCFLLDFLFRGIEKMHFVSIVFVIMKTISTITTILFVRADSDILLIPVFDIISSFFAILVSWVISIKLGYSVRFNSIKGALIKIKESFLYFTNSVASSAFGALNTAVIGICIDDLEQIAYWSVCMQLIGAVQTLYTPLSHGIYPYMIKNKNLLLVKRILLVFIPIVACCSFIAGLISPDLLTLISGEKYRAAAEVFKYLLPVLVFSFPVAILGWPTLGAIEKTKEINLSTLIGATIQILGLLVLYLIGQFTIINVAILRNISEIGMCLTLIVFTVRYRHLFDSDDIKELNKQI